MKQIPILAVVKESLTMPLYTPVPFLKALGILLAVAILFVVMMMTVGGMNAQMMSQMFSPGAGDTAQTAETIGAMTAALLFGIPTFLVLAMLAMAHLFNVGVRAGAMGAKHAGFDTFGQALGAAAVNGIKFFLIALVIGVISLIIMTILTAVGLGPDLMNAAAQSDIATATREMLLANIIVVLVSCAIYSIFSANLTHSALKSDREGLKHPHTVDFAIVLILLYAVLLVPTTLAGLAGSMMAVQVLNFILGLFVAVAVGVAHGVRYRVCVAEQEAKVFE